MKRRMFIASVCAISVAPKGTKAFNGNGEYYGRSQMTEILPQLRMENALYREYVTGKKHGSKTQWIFR